MEDYLVYILIGGLIFLLLCLIAGYYWIHRYLDYRMLALNHRLVDLPVNDVSDEALTLRADGKWHNIVTDSSGYVLVEILAIATGGKGHGKHSILFAHALDAFGNGKIKILRTSYQFKHTQLALRWKRDRVSYNLQIRTMSNYGPDSFIRVYLKQPYKEELLLENRLEYPSLFNCPGCGSKVSFDSKECPKCNYALGMHRIKKRKWTKFWAGPIGLSLIIIFIIFLFWCLKEIYAPDGYYGP